jgi:hypothetical protein
MLDAKLTSGRMVKVQSFKKLAINAGALWGLKDENGNIAVYSYGTLIAVYENTGSGVHTYEDKSTSNRYGTLTVTDRRFSVTTQKQKGTAFTWCAKQAQQSTGTFAYPLHVTCSQEDLHNLAFDRYGFPVGSLSGMCGGVNRANW